MLRADTQSIAAQNFGDFCHWSRRFKSEITDNHVSFIDEHTRSFFKFCERDARINVAIIIGPSDDDVRCIFRRRPQKRADTIGR